MNIATQSASLVWITPNALQVIESAGRTAYKSEDRITDGSADKFVRMITESGHDSVIEHASASIRFICDRGVSHELVRHRLFSFTQESTRYCNYTLGKFNGGIALIHPSNLTVDQIARRERHFTETQLLYETEISEGIKPQIARGVLPTCLKTEIVVTGNFREWRHFLKLRTSKNAHPQMQELAKMAQDILAAEVPLIFVP